MIWFTSDLHLGHTAVIEFCNRPYSSIEQMDTHLICQWNGSVKPDDTVYVLGDVCFHKPSVGVPMLKELHGNKILIQGNHDKYSRTQYALAGFAAVADEMKIRIAGWHVTLSHFPYWDASDTDPHDLRYEDRRPANRGGWLLCGHVHDKWLHKGRQINVGYDAWKYLPVSQGSIEALISKGAAE